MPLSKGNQFKGRSNPLPFPHIPRMGVGGGKTLIGALLSLIFVTGFVKIQLPRTITNTYRNTDFNYYFEVVYLGKDNRCLHAICLYSQFVCTPTVEWITIFDCFIGIANTTSTPYRSGGWVVGRYKVAG